MVSGQRQSGAPPMHHPGSNMSAPPSIPPPMGLPPMNINEDPTINNWSQSQPPQPINNGTSIWESGSSKDHRMSQGDNQHQCYLYIYL